MIPAGKPPVFARNNVFGSTGTIQDMNNILVIINCIDIKLSAEENMMSHCAENEKEET